MKFKIIFFKLKHIYYIILAFVFVVLFAIFLISKKSAETFNIFTKNKVISNYDVTGDGSKDNIYIKINNNRYSLEVKSKNKTYQLTPSPTLNSLGNYTNYSPLKLILTDVSRDNITEIFTQSSEDNTHLQHLFIWDKNKFKDIFHTTNNIIGFIDIHNNKTPKIISTNFNNNSLDFSNYILIKDKIKPYYANYPSNFIGKDTIEAFIKYIQTLSYYGNSKPNSLFHESGKIACSSVIDKLASENRKYVFQDGSFSDSDYNKNGEISDVKWVLNFKSTSNLINEDCKNTSIKLFLKSIGDSKSQFYFKIYSINILSN
ncbi:hypothetical protein [Clostridium felsineum]|uniref:Uncharacterized protein n=1 Tax=Clostridium felsineum TaxID=36839 RepID=A0A1S8KZG6_9CLOT|nr:hypothetical protein [Clostridium felsineum]MCR3759492.1 hypothetical protein [Clostridium felsineum]URZ04175.1 hypothetical protein CLAUR_042630 [Clostridium felsineum]URZ07635.1 hypothetical protein CLROS_029740 [Clostridium felsineum]URZ12666.1 hypothetical protein CROST_033890 [Clostridium felsineum]